MIRGLAEGLGDVDTAYARVADVLERTAKLEEAQATARQAQIKAAADAAFIVYWTDRTLFRFEWLGSGVPPTDPNTKTRLG